MNEDPDAPVTDIIFVKGLEECPEGYKMISNTPCQHKAQLWENLRGEEDEERYIAFIKDPNDKQVVEDFMITDGGGRYLRPGFVVMRRTLVGDKVFRHRDVAVKKGPRKAAVRAVLDVAVFKSNDKPSKLYRKIIKIHGLYVCVRVGPLQPKYKSGIGGVVPPAAPPPAAAATDQHSSSSSSSGAVGRTARNLTPEPGPSPGSERTLLEGAMGDMRIRSNTAPTSAPYPGNGPYSTPTQVGPYPPQPPQGTHSVAGSTANASTSVYGQHSDRPPPATALYPTSASSNGTSSTTAASLVPPFPSTDSSHKTSPSSNPSQPDHSSSQHHQQQRWPSAAAVIRQPPPINPAYPGGGGGGQYSSPQYPATQPPQHYSQPIGFGSMPGYPPPPPQHMHQNYAQAGSVYPPPANYQGFPQPLGTTGSAPYPVPQGGQVPPNPPPSYQSQAPNAPHSTSYGFNL